MSTPPGEPAAKRRFALLAATLAAAVLLDQLWWGGFEVASRHGVLALAGLIVLARPSSVPRFVLLLVAEVVSVAADMPVVGTHRLLGLVAATTALVFLAVGSVRDRRLPTPGEVFVGLAPFLRGSLVVLYTSAALAKINTTFLDPAASCAVSSARTLLGAHAAVLDDPRAAWTAILGTVVVEAVLPLLLAWRRTTVLGIVLGLGFHAVLALAGNVPFSALAAVFYVAFLPADLVERRHVPRPPGRPVRHALVGVLGAGWLVGALVGPSTASPGLTATPSAFVVPELGDALRGLTAVGLVGGALLVLVASRRAATPGRAGRLRSPVLVVGLLVLVIDAACPYIGWKTDTSFEMFSGLRTEPGSWNHLLVPEAVRVAGLQDGAVEVVAATDPSLVARTAGGARLLPFELDRTVRGEPGSTAVVRAAGDPTARPVGPLEPERTVAEWLATFRDLPPPGVPRC